MNILIKRCIGCQKDFNLDQNDLGFYEKLESPIPNYCPSCRMQRRLAHRNERTLYKRKCDLCKEDKISLYPAETPWPVYCASCWWGDGWDAKDFAQEYNSNKPFFEQFKELQFRVPCSALNVTTSVNSEYTNNAGDNKNCYLIFAAENNEDCYYGRLVHGCKFVADVVSIYDSELCYECIDCHKCYNCLFNERCQTSIDLLFCLNMRDSQNCIFSVNGRHKSYLIENEPCSKEEFETKKKEILSSSQNIEKAKKQFEELKSQSFVKYAFQTKCVRATGDYLFNCHDTKIAYDVRNAKNCAYLFDAEDPIDTYDGNNIYYKPELCLDMMGILQCYRCKFSAYIFYSSETEYSIHSYNISNCFGCIGMKKGEYCILNKQYSKDNYEKIKNQIIESMKKEGVYGDFIPPSLSSFGYNETLAKEYFPMTKEEAKSAGFIWQNKETGTFSKETISINAMPNTIEEVSDNILNEILVCVDCSRNFRITKDEFNFYKRMHLPLPRKDFECRHKDRMNKRNPRKLWHRKCMKENCSNEFETSYAPDRPEIVYCEECYQKEVY